MAVFKELTFDGLIDQKKNVAETLVQRVKFIQKYFTSIFSLHELHKKALVNNEITVPYEKGGATCNVSFFSANRNVLYFEDKFGFFLLLPNGYHFAIIFPHENIMVVKKHNFNESEKVATKILRTYKKINKNGYFKKQKGNYLGVVNGFARPYHYFYERFPEILRVIKNSTQKVNLLTINEFAFLEKKDLSSSFNVSEKKINLNNINEYLAEEKGFLLSPDIVNLDRFSNPLLSYSKLIPKCLEKVDPDRKIIGNPVIWIGLCDERRPVLNRIELISQIISSTLNRYPNAFFVFDGLTRPIGISCEEFQKKCEVENSYLNKLVGSCEMKYLSLIGATASEKINISKKIDFFFTSAFTDSMWASHFFSKNGVAYCPELTKFEGHSHINTSFVPESMITKLPANNAGMSSDSYEKDQGKIGFSFVNDSVANFFMDRLNESMFASSCKDLQGVKLDNDFAHRLKVKILGVHIRNTKNIGDRYCSPMDYFNFSRSPDDVIEIANLKDIKNHDKPNVVIIGGGAIASKAPLIRDFFPDSTLIAWGIGATKKGVLSKVEKNVHASYSAGFSLYGTRDYIKGIKHVACVSCMHPFFDLNIKPVCNAVVYGHSRIGNLREEAAGMGLPYLDNESELGFIGVLSFLASGKTIITNSYHGAYWGTLLGRKVSMIPFGSKFLGLKHLPPVVKDLQEGLLKAQEFPLALEDARAENINFYKEVCNLAWGVK